MTDWLHLEEEWGGFNGSKRLLLYKGWLLFPQLFCVNNRNHYHWCSTAWGSAHLSGRGCLLVHSQKQRAGNWYLTWWLVKPQPAFFSWQLPKGHLPQQGLLLHVDNPHICHLTPSRHFTLWFLLSKEPRKEFCWGGDLMRQSAKFSGDKPREMRGCHTSTSEVRLINLLLSKHPLRHTNLFAYFYEVLFGEVW